MKIPTTPPNGVPFYHGAPVNGIEMNPPWQANGVGIDGVAQGNGGAYIITHHIQQAGFVPPAGYFAPGASPPAPVPGPAAQDFSEYMWMENEEEFDKQVMQQLEEEALMEQCIEAMLADEREAQSRTTMDEASLEEQISKSTLNPLAAEFVPSFGSTAVVASTSDAQPGLSLLPSSAPKSVESSMNDLSISQTSDAPTESSKSSTAEIPDELCNLPLDSSPVKQEQPKDDAEKPISVDTVSAKVDDASSKASKSVVVPIIVAKTILKPEDSSKKSGESSKAKTDAPKDQKVKHTETKTPKNEAATVKNASSKPTDIKPETKKNEPTSSRPNQSKGAPKGKNNENKSKEPEKPKVPAEAAPIEKAATAPSTPAEPEKPQPVPSPTPAPVPVAAPVPIVSPPIAAVPVQATPAVFNYAAAARANLPPKSTPTVTQPATPAPPPVQPVIIRQESVPKEQQPQTNQSQPTAAAPTNANKPPPKTGPKQTKPNREAKDPTKTGGTFSRTAAGPRKSKK